MATYNGTVIRCERSGGNDGAPKVKLVIEVDDPRGGDVADPDPRLIDPGTDVTIDDGAA